MPGLLELILTRPRPAHCTRYLLSRCHGAALVTALDAKRSLRQTRAAARRRHGLGHGGRSGVHDVEAASQHGQGHDRSWGQIGNKGMKLSARSLLPAMPLPIHREVASRTRNKYGHLGLSWSRALRAHAPFLSLEQRSTVPLWAAGMGVRVNATASAGLAWRAWPGLALRSGSLIVLIVSRRGFLHRHY